VWPKHVKNELIALGDGSLPQRAERGMFAGSHGQEKRGEEKKTKTVEERSKPLTRE